MEAEQARQSRDAHVTETGIVRETVAAAVPCANWPRRLLWRVPFAVLGGLALRIWMSIAFPQGEGDALIYGNVAQNILLRGQYAITDGSGVAHSTLIRLPGYPLFLAACFGLFGVGNYRAVGYLQIALEMVACVMLADFVARIRSPRAGLNALWLAAMCPFTAVWASAPMTESLTFDMVCLAFWAWQRYLSRHDGNTGKRWLVVLALAVSYAALLRPDGALLAVALWPALVLSRSKGFAFGPALARAILYGAIAVSPFAVWGIRNWMTFHVVEPLAPRYANDPGEDPHMGWQHWVKTWCLDFACTYELYWNVPDQAIALAALPGRAFDSAQQREQTAALVADYNQSQDLTNELDARFEALAQERRAAHPLRIGILLPFGRLTDMMLRPRVENLPIDLHWWEFSQHYAETRFSWGYAVLNLLFLLLGLVGFCLRPRLWPYLATYLVLRSLLLLTVEAPETRYTLEFFPVFFAMGGIALERIFSRKARVANKPA